MNLTTDKLTCIVTDKRIFVTTKAVPQSTDDSLQRLYQGMRDDGILRAYRQEDGSFDTDSQAGFQRYVATKSARAVGFALRRIGFTTQQTRAIFKATK